VFPLFFHPVINSFSPLSPLSTQEQMSFYKQTKTRNCKTMVVLPKGFIEESYNFSSKTFLPEIGGAWSFFYPLVN